MSEIHDDLTSQSQYDNESEATNVTGITSEQIDYQPEEDVAEERKPIAEEQQTFAEGQEQVAEEHQPIAEEEREVAEGALTLEDAEDAQKDVTNEELTSEAEEAIGDEFQKLSFAIDVPEDLLSKLEEMTNATEEVDQPIAEPSSKEELPEEPKTHGEIVEEEEKQEEEALTEGERMLAEIDTSKVIEETDTELDYQRHVEMNLSHITLNEEEQPEIRGLADLEYESPEESLEEINLDVYMTKKRSTRPSVAVRLLAEEMAAEKRRMGRKDMAKGKAVVEGGEIKIDIPWTREEYYALYDKLNGDISYIRMKNRYLQRKMADLLKKRKMEHALKEESELRIEVVQKYEKKLDRLADLFELYQSETTKITEELERMQKVKDEKDIEKQILFTKAVNREREIGIGLISTKTGKEIPDKVVEQLIRRQSNAARQISELRLRYIAMRDELAEKNAELKSLDNIGDNLSLMDYEQLKIENRAHSDKLEEKEGELTKLRIKCRNAVQIMAHVREKCAALDADMDVLKEQFEEVHLDYIQIRERLNYCKTERDIIRNKTMKLKEESGLLTKPKLLQDMETSMEEVKLYEKTLEKVKNEYNEKTQQIRYLRKNIAYEMIMNKKHHKEKKKKTSPVKFFKIRPTLVTPKLPKNFLDSLAKKLGKNDK